MRCPKCKATNFERSDFCCSCGAPLRELLTDSRSGTGRQAQIAAEAAGWNWGAFLLGWIWGIGNNVWIALLTLIPGYGLIMHVVLGLKGNEWAWQNKRWADVDEFKRVQRRWAVWGVVLFVVGLAILAVYILVVVLAALGEQG